MTQPHPWLGREFRELLPDLAACPDRVTLAVTRPSGRSYGSGALRVVAVRCHQEGPHLVLAYERYLPPYSDHSQGRQKSRSRKRGRKRG